MIATTRVQARLPIICTTAAIAASALGAGIWMFRDDLAEILEPSAEPHYYLWAWRRAEDLSFIDPARVKVALWTGTIFVGDDDFHVEHRLNPITYPTQAEIVGVVRLEATGVPDDGIVAPLADAIIAASRPFRPVEHQVDFDARLSQRDFYRRLLDALRVRTGEAKLSITALASWCFYDDWVRALPVDAVVPMIYRMGPEGDAIRHTLYTEREFPAPVCAGNIGYSADEPLAPVDGLRRVFLFHPKPWTEHSFRAMIEKVENLP